MLIDHHGYCTAQHRPTFIKISSQFDAERQVSLGL